MHKPGQLASVIVSSASPGQNMICLQPYVNMQDSIFRPQRSCRKCGTILLDKGMRHWCVIMYAMYVANLKVTPNTPVFCYACRDVAISLALRYNSTNFPAIPLQILTVFRSSSTTYLASPVL